MLQNYIEEYKSHERYPILRMLIKNTVYIDEKTTINNLRAVEYI